MQLSPYTPGEVAREVPGREAQLQQIGGMLTLPALHGRFSGRIRVDVGPRGVGKTSLLRRVQEDAILLGLAPLYVTAGNGPLAAVIADEARTLVSEWGAPSATSDWLDRLSVTLGVPGIAQITAETSPGVSSPQATRAFRKLLEKTSKEALNQGLKGIAVLVDELQDADDESLRTIAYAWQELQGSKTPAVFIAAGLSHTADVVTAAVTSDERFQFRTMRDLEDHEVREALTQPAADLGVRWGRPRFRKSSVAPRGTRTPCNCGAMRCGWLQDLPIVMASSGLKPSKRPKSQSMRTCRRCTVPGGRRHRLASGRFSRRWLTSGA